MQVSTRPPLFETLEPRVLLSGQDIAFGADIALGDAAPAPMLSVNDDLGNAFAEATPLVLHGRRTSGAVSGSIDYAGDVDVLSVMATKTGVMTVRQSPWEGMSAVSADLYAYDVAGDLLAHDGDPADNGATLEFPVVQGRTYYLKFGCLGDAMGQYSVTASIAKGRTNGSQPDEDPVDDYAPGSRVRTDTAWLGSGYRLVVVGTEGADTITLSQDAGGMTLTTAWGTTTYSGSFSATVIYGFGGDDIIRLTQSVAAGATIYGGAGNDSIFEAGTGEATIYGGAGDDLIVTVGGGADMVFGEGGLDSLWMDSSDRVADVSAAEVAAGSVHQVASFYQPVTDPAKAVSLEIAGQDIVDPVAGYSYYDFSTRPLFLDGPEASDVRQGSLGDCNFLASLASLADTDPQTLRQMIAPMGDGTYGVRFFRAGAPVYLRVDGQLPGSRVAPAYAKLSLEGETWVAMAEKAYAQFRTGSNSYTSLSGGWMDPVYQAVTGQATTRVMGSASGLAATLASHLAAGHAVSAGTWSSTSGPVVGAHAYVVRAMETRDGVTYITVYNPWGFDGKGADANPNDGLVQVTLAQFQKDFSAVVISLA